MNFTETSLSGCFVIDAEPITDDRGFFARTFCARTFQERGLNPALAQASRSYNRQAGTLRGLHFQSHPAMEDKLVRCERGAVFDVAVDLRPGSPTFGGWVGQALTADNGRQLYIPKGFAHGFQTLEPDTVVYYHIAQAFVPGLTAGVAWDDPDIAVPWPLPPVGQSPRDLELPKLADVDRSLLTPFGGAKPSR